MANKAIKYRIYPTTEQSIMFSKTFGCCRKVYNLMLSDKIEGYKGCPPTSDISLENLSNQITRQMITLKQNTAYELLYYFKRRN